MKSKLLGIISMSLFSSCGLILHMVVVNSKASKGPLDTEGRTDIESPYNSDNEIYQTNRTFVYQVNQKDKNRNLKFQLELVVIPGAFNLKETKIKYKYHYNAADLTEQEQKDFGLTEQNNYLYEYTSLIEEKNTVQLHPPRSKTLTCLEKAPFPELPHKLYKGAKKEVMLYIPHGNWGELGGSKIKWRYEVDSVTFKNDTVPYYCRVQGTANSKKGGYNTLEMQFKADSGFTKLSYRFQDLTEIDFVLKEIK
jgi:hypothetical protein